MCMSLIKNVFVENCRDEILSYNIKSLFVCLLASLGLNLKVHVKNLCKTATLKKTKNWFSRPIIA